MRSDRLFTIYLAALHIVLAMLLGALAYQRLTRSEFRIEEGGRRNRLLTLYHRDQLLFYAEHTDGVFRSFTVYPQGTEATYQIERESPTGPWRSVYMLLAKGSFYGRDLGNVLERYDDTDGDGATDTYLKPGPPPLLKRMKQDAWEEVTKTTP